MAVHCATNHWDPDCMASPIQCDKAKQRMPPRIKPPAFSLGETFRRIETIANRMQDVVIAKAVSYHFSGCFH